MPDTFVRTRCSTCGKVLSFEDFSSGSSACLACARNTVPTVEIRGPRVRRRNARNAAPPQFVPDFDVPDEDIPEELIAELVAALEAEARSRANPGPVREVLEEIGLGESPREKQWAAWGFAAGFAANVAIAKYAQMATGAPMGDFLAPLLVGGVVAGLCCAAIGWGVAKLREPATA